MSYAILIDAVEITQLRDNCAGLIDDNDLIFLIGADPDVVLAVDRDPIRRVDAGNEDRGSSRTAIVVHGNLDDLMRCRICYKQYRVLTIELDTIRSKRRRQAASRTKQWTRTPCDRSATTGRHLPNDPIEGIRHISVAGSIKGQRIQTGAGDWAGQHGGGAGYWINFQDLAGPEVQNP